MVLFGAQSIAGEWSWGVQPRLLPALPAPYPWLPGATHVPTASYLPSWPWELQLLPRGGDVGLQWLLLG